MTNGLLQLEEVIALTQRVQEWIFKDESRDNYEQKEYHGVVPTVDNAKVIVTHFYVNMPYQNQYSIVVEANGLLVSDSKLCFADIKRGIESTSSYIAIKGVYSALEMKQSEKEAARIRRVLV